MIALKQIGSSGLSNVECDVLRTMLEWWNPRTHELWPTIPTVARQAHRAASTVRKVYAKLRKLGVLHMVEESKGGIDEYGNGVGHRIRLDLDKLNPLPSGGLEGANPLSGSVEPAGTERQTRRCGALNPPPSGGKLSIELANEPTTTTTNGGGGGSVRSRGSEEGGSERKQRTQQPSDSDTPVRTSRLRAFKVSAGVARSLAKQHSLEEIDAGIDYVESQRGADDPPGLLVSVLRDGTAAEHLEELNRKREAVRQARLGVTEKVAKLITWAKSDKAPELHDAIAAIHARWGNVEQVILEADFDPREINQLDRLPRAASRAKACELINRWDAQARAFTDGMEAAQ